MGPMISRPTLAQYQQVLEYYKTGQTLESIAERLGLSIETLEHLETDGWPDEEADGEKRPAMPALRSQVLDRLTRVRAGELDLLTAIAEMASKTAITRSRSGQLYAQIENAIVSTWAKQVQAAMKDPAVEIATLLQPKHTLDNLKALRQLQDPTVDKSFVDIFVRMSGRGPEDGGSSLEEEIVRDLAGLSKEELETFVVTGKVPARQQELAFPQGAAAA